jgi:glycosyltransferase involved in cell wall biosynthesis
MEKAIAEEDLAIAVHWLDTPAWLRPLVRGKIFGTINYCAWQAMASVMVRRLERRLPVDVVHHVTFASDSLPSALLASRAPIRVWGPVGGAGRSTVRLYRYLTPRGIVYEMVRGVSNWILRATSGRLVARHATLIAALNNDVRDHWRRGRTPVVVQSNTALDPSEIGSARPRRESLGVADHRSALFVGRLIPLKGLRLAVESLRYAPDWKLVVLGEGPDGVPASKLAARLGVADRIEFRGLVPRSDVLQALQTADCLLFTSLHDSSPWAVGEASAQGCPVICLDTGGPPLQAGRNAHVVPIAPERSLPRRIGESLQNLAGEGVPDDHLLADRIPALLETWYSGNVTAVHG